MKTVCTALSCLLLAGCATYAAAPVSTADYPAKVAARTLPARAAPYTDADLLALALANSADVANARARYLTAVAAARVARQAPSPTLTLTAEYSKAAGGSSPWLYGVATDFPLDLGARRSTRMSSADLTALQALYDYGEAIWAVRTTVVRAAAELRAAGEGAPLADQALTLRRDRFDRLARRVAAGEDARAIELLAQTEMLTAQRRVTDVQSRRIAARASLGAALGLPGSAIDAIALAPAEAAVDPIALQQWRNEAALSRRDVLRAVADYDLAEGALRLEIAKQYPAMSIGPGYTWERGVTKLPFTLGLTLPPYDLNRANIARAEAARAQAGAALEAVQATVLASVDQSSAALAAARQVQAQILARDLPVAERTAASMQRGVAAGEFDRTDQLAADAAALETRIAASDALRAAQLAVIDVEDALRRPLDPAQAELLKAKTAGDLP